MSLERRKPLALLYPNAKPTDPALAPNSAPPQLSISRPRRQMTAYHHHHHHHQPHQQYNPHKRYATVLPGSSRSSATSSAGSVCSSASSIQPRRRKLSAAEDVAARVRARWAALEALERTSGPQAAIATPADAITATNTITGTTATTTATNSNIVATTATTKRNEASRNPEHESSFLDMGKEREKENERSVSTSMLMQVDGYEKPLPPRPAPLALTLRINPDQGPASAPARMPAASPMMMVDTREGDKNGDGAGEGEFPPTSDSTLRTTPTSLTCFETTESQRQVLQRRPNRALTPPQVRRRPSITDELEEAREEATLAMLQTSRTDGLLRCPRRGCDALLSGVRALTFHLHIHAVGAGAYTCVRCGGAFESARDLTRHACARRRARERLRGVVRAWTCLSSTNQGLEKQAQPRQPKQQHLPPPTKHYKRKDYY